jgi:hypothetical protein
MNVPIDREDGRNDPPLPLPPWARASATRNEPRFATAPSTAKGEDKGAGKIDWPPLSAQPPRVASDAAIKLRSWRSLDPDPVPYPRSLAQPKARGRSSWVRISLYVGLAAAVLYGVVEMTLAYRQGPLAPRPDSRSASMMAPQLAVMQGAAKPAVTRLVIEERQALANEPLPLGVVLHGATGGEAIVLSGLTQGTLLSAGEALGATGWRVPARELGHVLAYPPVSFVGVMDTAVELRAPDNARLDTQFAKLEWVPKSGTPSAMRASRLDRSDIVLPGSATAKLSPERMARLVGRGVGFLKDGDFAAARLMLRLPADAGDASAALLLGATYDPAVLAELGVFGLRPDRAAARAWYQRARNYGSAEASRRIERLAQTDQ